MPRNGLALHLRLNARDHCALFLDVLFLSRCVVPYCGVAGGIPIGATMRAITTQFRHAALVCTAACTVALAAATAFAQDGGLAGPIWEEGPTTGGGSGSQGSKDAGAQVNDAQSVSSPSASNSGSALTQVKGKTASGVLSSDSVDMYRIMVNNASTFHVNTVSPDTNFDTVLFLFKEVVLPDGSVTAQPIAMNDDTYEGTVYSYQSRLKQELVSGCTTGQCYTIPTLGSGIHYLAVGKYQALPVQRLRGVTLPLFTYSQDPTDTVLPTAPQAARNPNDWTGAAPGGDYAINIVGGVVVSRSATCVSAPVLGPGTHAFGLTSTLDDAATTIGYENLCGGSGATASIVVPTWFRVAPVNGTVVISVCPTSSGSTTAYGFVVYEGGCGDLTPVACGAPSLCAGGARVALTVSDCDDLLVAFGPFMNAGGLDSWTPRSGAITIETFETPVCPPSPDVNGDGTVDGNDLALLLNGWTQ